jgi:fatty acid desaturase
MRHLAFLFLFLPLLLAGCTPIGDRWSPGLLIAVVIGAAAGVFLLWRHFAGHDTRHDRREDRREERRD